MKKTPSKSIQMIHNFSEKEKIFKRIEEKERFDQEQVKREREIAIGHLKYINKGE